MDGGDVDPNDDANRIPLVALLLGMACGTSVRGRELLMSLLSPLLAGAVFWFFGVVSGGLLVTFGGVDEETADYIPLVAFWSGVALVALPALAVLHDRFVNARGRLRKRGDGAATDMRPREP